MPVQLSVHLPVPQVMLPHAGAPPVHVRSHALVPEHVTSPHAFMPVQLAMQLPLEHVMLPHAPPVTDVVHPIVQALPEQEIAPHALSPMHVMSHDGVEHVTTPVHCAVSLQLIVQ